MWKSFILNHPSTIRQVQDKPKYQNRWRQKWLSDLVWWENTTSEILICLRLQGPKKERTVYPGRLPSRGKMPNIDSANRRNEKTTRHWPSCAYWQGLWRSNDGLTKNEGWGFQWCRWWETRRWSVLTNIILGHYCRDSLVFICLRILFDSSSITWSSSIISWNSNDPNQWSSDFRHFRHDSIWKIIIIQIHK